MSALKSKVRKGKKKFKVANVKGTTVGGEISLECMFDGSSELYYVHVDSKFEAPYARELARWLMHNEIAPESKPTAANAINRLLGELGIAAPRLTVEAPKLADQAPSDGTLHHTLPPALSAPCTSSRLLAEGKRRTRSSASTDNTSSSKRPKVDSDKGGGAEDSTAAGAGGRKRKEPTGDSAPGTSPSPLFAASCLASKVV
jgi:hypothetical protein